MKPQHCPCCGRLMEYHTHKDRTGMARHLFYCERCDADYALTENGLSVMLEPHDTRPMKPAEISRESH